MFNSEIAGEAYDKIIRTGGTISDAMKWVYAEYLLEDTDYLDIEEKLFYM